MSAEAQNWILTGLVGFMLMAGWWSARSWIQTVTNKIDQLIMAVQKQSESNVRQSSEINNISKRIDTSEVRLNDHSKRLNNIEIKIGNE
ncbi:MAG: hypothetical protein QM503_04560 [Bacteroidota bacterium]